MSIFNNFMLARYIEINDNTVFDRQDAVDTIKDIELPEYKWSWRDLFYIGGNGSDGTGG